MQKTESIKEQKIKAVFKRYGYNLPISVKEPFLNLASNGILSTVEVKNIYEGRAPWQFNKEDLKTLKLGEIKEIVERYTKSTFPNNLSYELYRSFLSYEFNITKVSKKDMDILAEYFKSAAEMTATMWVGFINKVKSEVYNRDIKKAENFLDKAWKNMQEYRYREI